MAKEIFRKASLDRLASPEQLDQLLQVTTARGWLALIALCGAVAAGLAWGFLGEADATVPGQGVILRSGGVFNVVSSAGGRVVALQVHVGEVVRVNQVVARVAQPSLLEKLQSAREELASAELAKSRSTEARAEGDRAKREVTTKQIASLEQEIRDDEQQIKLGKEQLPVDEQLVAKGLITKQTAIGNQQKVASLESNITKLQAQISQVESDQVSTKNQADQSDLDHRGRIEDLARNVRSTEQELERASNVVSPNAGRVVELKVYRGDMVPSGAPIISIEPLENSLEAVAYVASAQVKEIRQNMDVHISPSGIQREEYGYLIGTVASVADFPATSESVVRIFENDALAKTMLAGGPVTEIRVRFLADASTPSGFKWSSPHGPPSRVSSGAVCTVDVLTREQHPIALVLPYLKKMLGIG